MDKKCEALLKNRGKGWILFALPGDEGDYHPCGKPAIIAANNEYRENPSPIWICADCDRISATEVRE